MNFNNKIAIITGGARGIGFAIAKKMVGAGGRVALFDRLTAELTHARSVLGEKNCHISTVDVTDPLAVAAGFDAVERELGPVDIVINNAGITRDGMVHKLTEENWDAVMEVNLKGIFLVGREAAKRMRERGKGVILNTASVVALYGNIGQSNYAAAKAGVVALTKTWAKELGPKGVRVNAVAPGFTATEMTRAVPSEILTALGEKTPLRRLAQPEEIADGFLFLASDRASFITGAVLSIDGGLTL